MKLPAFEPGLQDPGDLRDDIQFRRPDRWRDNERAALEARRREQGWSDAKFDAALEDLERRYEEMLLRLDGTYQIPK